MIRSRASPGDFEYELKSGVYSIWPGAFYSPNKEELYELPSVDITMSNKETFNFQFVEKDEAKEFHQFALNLISR